MSAVLVGLACLLLGYTVGQAVTLIDGLFWRCIAWTVTFLATSVVLHLVAR